MKFMKLSSILMVIFLAECSGSKELSCSDKNITDTVMSITVAELREQLFKIYLASELGGLPRIAANMSYDEYRSMESNDVQRRVVSETEATVSAFSLANIRLNSVNDRTGQVSCAASLRGRNNESMNIQYTAQRTEDGEVYVKVFGLR